MSLQRDGEYIVMISRKDIKYSYYIFNYAPDNIFEMHESLEPDDPLLKEEKGKRRIIAKVASAQELRDWDAKREEYSKLQKAVNLGDKSEVTAQKLKDVKLWLSNFRNMCGKRWVERGKLAV